MQQPGRHRRSTLAAVAAVVALTVAVGACSSADPEPEVLVPQKGPGPSAPGTSAPGTTAGPPRSGTTQTTLPRPSSTTNTTIGSGAATPTTPTSFAPGPIEPLPDDSLPGIDDPAVPTDDDSTTTTEAEPEIIPGDYDLPFPTTSEP